MKPGLLQYALALVADAWLHALGLFNPFGDHGLAGHLTGEALFVIGLLQGFSQIGRIAVLQLFDRINTGRFQKFSVLTADT